MKEFVVVRVANKPNGTVAIPVSSYEDEASARKEYYRQCGLAVDSGNLTDAVTLLSKVGYEIAHEYFVHEAPEPEPEPEPEEEENS